MTFQEEYRKMLSGIICISCKKEMPKLGRSGLCQECKDNCQEMFAAMQNRIKAALSLDDEDYLPIRSLDDRADDAYEYDRSLNHKVEGVI
jgi:predicted amidophosphoribosyltransferase